MASTAVVDQVSRILILDKISKLGQRKKKLEALVRELKSTAHKEVDIDATVDDIMGTVESFEDLFPHGTLEEQKEFVRPWVEKIELDPDKRVGKVYIKKFLLPANGTGKPSFEMVAGAGFEPATFGL